MNEDYIIPFDDIDVSLEDENYIFNLLKSHDQTKVLDYHGYLSPRLTFKTKLAKDLKLRNAFSRPEQWIYQDTHNVSDPSFSTNFLDVYDCQAVKEEIKISL
mgnify:CR=1 FL=1